MSTRQVESNDDTATPNVPECCDDGPIVLPENIERIAQHLPSDEARVWRLLWFEFLQLKRNFAELKAAFRHVD